MPESAADDDENPFRPVWETEGDPEPPGPPRAHKRPAAPDYGHPLLMPLARAENALARLQAKTEAASAVVAEGLRMRLSFLEAAGWLAHAHIAIHPHDLALREYGGVTSYGAAARADQLATVLPSTMADHADLDHVVATGAIGLDNAVSQALRYARLWRRLAEYRSWRPLNDIGSLREALQSRAPDDAEIADFQASIQLHRGPVLIRAGRAASEWMNLPGINQQSPNGVFIAACLWQESNRSAPIPLPFWSAPEQRHHRMSLKYGVERLAEFLECVAAAAIIGRRELERLQDVEKKGRAIGVTKRSRLPDAVHAVLRAHIVTAATLAKAIGVTPQAATALLRQLTGAGIVREATGQASWRAFVLA
jgi:hypothetical protein